jgi:hypothetical protein
MEAIQQAAREVRFSQAGKGEVISHYAQQRGLILGESGMAVIVQEMIEADTSGVIFSHDLAKPDGYYAISVSSGLGETIVGGAANGQLIRVARGMSGKEIKDAWLGELITTMKAIEQRFRSTSLDVEFAIQGATLYILQCRPITTAQAMASGKKQEKRLLKRIKSLSASVAVEFSGDVLGDMIDINPLELLGMAPTPLDISIFRYLFADQIVERVRRDMGYDPLDIGLLQVIAGKPYTSLRAAAFSFRPTGISDQIYGEVVRVYREELVKNPALQSRVEFDLFAMSYGKKLDEVLQRTNLNSGEKSIVRDAFQKIDSALSQVSMAQHEMFEEFAIRYEQRSGSMTDAPLDTLLAHVATGTEMFVRVARLAFYWKNKFEEVHPQENLNRLIRGHINSIDSQLQSDLVACRNGLLSREKLIERYGHLRPGQFSVFGESYADDPDNYLFAQMEEAKVSTPVKRSHNFEKTIEFKHVISFMRARERMKFLFSQSLHLFTSRLKQQLVNQGIPQSEAVAISWEELRFQLQGLGGSTKNRKHNLPAMLPDVLIPGVTDLRVITFAQAMPSYITSSIIKASVCILERIGMKADVRGCLVVLPNADPGYDFLFHAGAVGIITKVGGPASHMCIRAIELGTPACIGCGESVYQKLSTARSAILDCNTRQIIVLW